MKTVLNWSSGKDAALAYDMLLRSDYKVIHLLTTVNKKEQRIVMHGVRQHLLDAQSERMNLPLTKIALEPSPSNSHYEEQMQRALENMKQQGITTAAFGDIFLEDLKLYRERQLETIGFHAVFPLWQQDTRKLVELAEDTGIEAIIVCVNKQALGSEFLGKKVDRKLLSVLPSGVDPCGENGEYHSFVFNAPFFKAPIDYTTGATVLKSYSGSEPQAEYFFLDIF